MQEIDTRPECPVCEEPFDPDEAVDCSMCQQARCHTGCLAPYIDPVAGLTASVCLECAGNIEEIGRNQIVAERYKALLDDLKQVLARLNTTNYILDEKLKKDAEFYIDKNIATETIAQARGMLKVMLEQD